MFALTETWINPFTTLAELLNSVPTGFSLNSFPHPACPNNKNNITGGGTAFLFMTLVKFSPVHILFLNHLK
jgi:hypothetical protein